MARSSACLADAPLTIDPSGVWFRPEGRFYLAGTTPAPGNDPAGAPLEVQHQEWEDMVWPALAHRVPAFEAAKVVNSWTGYYEYNTFDQNGIVGRHPEIDSIVFATGFSGHDHERKGFHVIWGARGNSPLRRSARGTAGSH